MYRISSSARWFSTIARLFSSSPTAGLRSSVGNAISLRYGEKSPSARGSPATSPSRRASPSRSKFIRSRCACRSATAVTCASACACGLTICCPSRYARSRFSATCS